MSITPLCGNRQDTQTPTLYKALLQSLSKLPIYRNRNRCSRAQTTHRQRPTHYQIKKSRSHRDYQSDNNQSHPNTTFTISLLKPHHTNLSFASQPLLKSQHCCPKRMDHSTSTADNSRSLLTTLPNRIMHRKARNRVPMRRKSIEPIMGHTTTIRRI